MPKRMDDGQVVGCMKNFIRMSQVAAMWPRWKSGIIFTIWYYATFCLIVGSLCCNGTSLILKIFIAFEGMNGIAPVVDLVTLLLDALFRYLYVFFKGATIKKFVDSMYELLVYRSFNPEGKVFTMKETVINGRRVSYAVFIICYFLSAHMFIAPIVLLVTDPTVHQIPLIYDGWLPCNETSEPCHSIAFTIQSLSTLLVGYAFLAVDSFWFMVIFLMIGQLQLIAFSFSNLVPASSGDEIPPLSQEIKKALAQTVKQHQKVRRLIGNLRDIMSPIFFVDFLHAILSITFILLDVTVALTTLDGGKLTDSIHYLLVSIGHALACYYFGNELIVEEDRVAVAIYNTPWYRYMDTFAYPLTMTTYASRMPNRLTGANFFDLTLEFFVFFMNTIFSYFMVLLELRDQGDDMN